MTSSTDRVTPRDVFWPTLRAIQELGGSATRQELLAKVASMFTEAAQADMMPNGRESRVQYYAGWNLTRLKRIGLIDNSQQGVWALTERGRRTTEDEIDELWQEANLAFRDLRREGRTEAEPARSSVTEVADPDLGADELSDAWKDELLARLRALEPASFERLCQRLLREAGVEQVQLLGGAGDQGIDGVGLAHLGLLSFPVYFQAKRYGNPVTPSVVRDFRGTMAGRGEKGLLIATASFTPAAYREATRDGVTPIDLIDGDRLCDLLKRYRLGVRVTEHVVEDVTVDDTFWNEFE